MLVLGFILFLVLVVVYACCRIGEESDREMRKLFREEEEK